MTHFPVKVIYRMPMMLGFVTVVGLLSALLGDGIWDSFSWVLLGVPLVTCVFFLFRRRES
jgi:hypothetical protein